MVGDYHLNERLIIVAAGNKDTDNAIVEEMSSALASRLTHLYSEVSKDDWLDWAVRNGIHPKITSFINFKPGCLYTFSPESDDADTYACPRTWEMVSKILQQTTGDITKVEKALLQGTLGSGTAQEFLAYLRLFTRLPDMKTLLANPSTAKLPEEPGVLYALTGSLASIANKTTADAVVTVINRLPAEYQIVTLVDVAKRDPSMFSHPAIAEWATTTGQKYF